MTATRDSLFESIEALRAGGIATREFCDAFERAWNFEVDRTSLSEVEQEAFGELFEAVVWYSPFPEERAEMTSYLDEAAIAEAVETAWRRVAAVGVHRCPVCGFAGLEEPAWNGDSPSDEICPSCGIQFGYHDSSPLETERRARWQMWRDRWVEQGCPWSSAGPPSEGWDPRVQLERLGRS